eukprot:6213600-Pleurochrysis_carterae.AAC.4
MQPCTQAFTLALVCSGRYALVCRHEQPRRLRQIRALALTLYHFCSPHTLLPRSRFVPVLAHLCPPELTIRLSRSPLSRDGDLEYSACMLSDFAVKSADEVTSLPLLLHSSNSSFA